MRHSIDFPRKINKHNVNQQNTSMADQHSANCSSSSKTLRKRSFSFSRNLQSPSLNNIRTFFAPTKTRTDQNHHHSGVPVPPLPIGQMALTSSLSERRRAHYTRGEESNATSQSHSDLRSSFQCALISPNDRLPQQIPSNTSLVLTDMSVASSSEPESTVHSCSSVPIGVDRSGSALGCETSISTISECLSELSLSPCSLGRDEKSPLVLQRQLFLLNQASLDD